MSPAWEKDNRTTPSDSTQGVCHNGPSKNDLARHQSRSGSVVRACDRFTEGQGLDSRRELTFSFMSYARDILIITGMLSKSTLPIHDHHCASRLVELKVNGKYQRLLLIYVSKLLRVSAIVQRLFHRLSYSITKAGCLFTSLMTSFMFMFVRHKISVNCYSNSYLRFCDVTIA